MDFTSFKHKYLGEQVADPLLAGVLPYTDVALIKRYLKEVHGITATYWGDAMEWWTKPNPALLSAFTTLETTDLVEGDIVITNKHISLATGNGNSSQVEVMEQNGDVGSGLGTGEDAIRLTYLPKSTIVGVIRPVTSKPEVAVTPVVAPKVVADTPPVYKAPTGGLKVNLHLETIYIKTPIATYGSPIAASSHTKPKEKKLNPGTHQTDLVKMGMKRLVTEGNDETWINPADNVVAKVEVPTIVPVPEKKPEPKLDGVIEAESNYLDFTTPEGKLQEKYYTAKEGGAFVLDFKTGNTRTMPGGAHIWLAGITGVGQIGYGIATKCLERDPPLWVGVRLGDLYEDDTFSKHTTIEERKALRRLTWSDHITLKKARLAKLIQDVRG